MYTIRIRPEATVKNNDLGINSNPLTRLDRIEYVSVIYCGVCNGAVRMVVVSSLISHTSMTINLDIKPVTYCPSSKTVFCLLVHVRWDRGLEADHRFKYLMGSSLMYASPVPVAPRCKVKIYGRWSAEIVGSNPTEGMDVCLL
jgi:hypothetical protein